MKKDNLLFLLVSLLSVIMCIISSNLFKNKYASEKELHKELDEVLNLINDKNISVENIKTRLATTVTNDEYKKIEISIKKYFFDVYNDTIKVKELLDSDNITNIITLDNYKNDGKSFTKTKKYINSTSIKLNYYCSRLYENITQSSVMKYIDNNNLDDYYLDLYNEYTYVYKGIIRDSINKLKEELNNTIYYLDTCYEIVNFLASNTTMWEISNDNVIFFDDNLLSEYNTLLEKIK